MSGGLQKIALLNSKGGTGKTMLAVNLAAYYALHNYQVALTDNDQQNSSMRWIERRGDRKPPIFGLDATNPNWKWSNLQHLLDDRYARVIIDTSAALHDRKLGMVLHLSNRLVIPVTPSPLDIDVTVDFIAEVLLHPEYVAQPRPLCVVANRCRPEHDNAFDDLQRFLKAVDLPLIAKFGESPRYVNAMRQGQSVHEMPLTKVQREVDAWSSLTHWLNSPAPAHEATPRTAAKTAPETTTETESEAVKPAPQ